VGPRAVLDAVVKRKIPSPRRESNPRITIVQPVVLPEAISPEVKWPERGAKHSPSSSVEVNAWSCTSTLPRVFMGWCLINQEIRLHGMV
jgi:hypothetical protein